ncbi:MAG: hypothetical protein ACJAQ3_004481, partial [Planctomycetota bacterium]
PRPRMTQSAAAAAGRSRVSLEVIMGPSSRGKQREVAISGEPEMKAAEGEASAG